MPDRGVESATGGVARRLNFESSINFYPVYCVHLVNHLIPEGNVFTVYVLQSSSSKRYTGHTKDLAHRIVEHNSGMCKTTKTDVGWRVVYTEEFQTRSEAMAREKWLKTGAGREFLRQKIPFSNRK